MAILEIMFRQLSLFDHLDISEKSTDSYVQLEGNIPPDIPNGCLISIHRETPLKIYSLGFQPAKSIPEIPRWFFNKYACRSFSVLEPFAGSGTTILEGLSCGASVFWLDYHPLSRLICQVKTTNFNSSQVIEESHKIFREICNQEPVGETVKFNNLDFWFQKPVQIALEIIKFCILKSNPDIHPIFWLAFAHTVRKVSDMNDGMLLAAKRSKVAEIPQRSQADVYHQFKLSLDQTIAAICEWQKILKSSAGIAYELPYQDARILPGTWTVDAVMTSPPYINAIDYVWAAKFELHWLNLVKSDKDRLDLYSKEIGTERIASQEYQELGITGNLVLDRLIEQIYTGKNYQATKGQNQLRARVVYKYFLDMKKHFSESLSHLNPGGYYCFAIGDVSRICGVDIPVASLLIELAKEVGFSQIFEFHILLKNRKLNIPRNVNWANTIKHDTVVVLQKN